MNKTQIAAYMVGYIAARNRRFRVDLRAFKLLRGCIDCGYDADANALQFDHREPRGRSPYPTKMVTARPETLGRELEKCDVRCANCHAVKTAARRKVI